MICIIPNYQAGISAGTIYACNLFPLLQDRSPGLPGQRVTFMLEVLIY